MQRLVCCRDGAKMLELLRHPPNANALFTCSLEARGEPVSREPTDLPAEEEASYLLLNEQWVIVGADEAADLAAEWGAAALVGQHARDVIGEQSLAALRRDGRAVFSLDGVDHVLSLSSFTLAGGVLHIVRAQEVEATLEHVVSIIVHELRNPLSAMRTLVQGLEEEVDGAPGARAYTQRLTGEIDRLGRLLASMSQVARLQHRPPEVLDLGPLLEKTADLFRPEFVRRQIEVRVHVTARVAPVRADADQIAQLLVNLMNNAADAMPDGGVITLRARLDPRGRSMIQVEDTGVGMDMAQLSAAMRPRQSTKPGGMGLGLMIVRGIVRQHGGRIRVASTPGRGTTISVTFPSEGGSVGARESGGVLHAE
jgi:signal transduction histidine kinase